MMTLNGRFWLCLSLVGLSLSMTGCGKLETGAHAEPSVRIKLADLAPVSTGEGNAEKPGAAPIRNFSTICGSQSGRMPA